MFYRQFYPNTTIELIPLTYSLCGRVTLYCHLIGSVLPGGNNVSLSAIMALGGDITSEGYTTLSVGIVQHFIKHTIHIKQSADNKINIMEHIFAVVKWMKRHPN